ncbi:MAG: transporter [Sphingomicrobium sp.]
MAIILAALLVPLASAATAQGQPICPDRPSKSTGACTAAAGHWQIETGLLDWAHGHQNTARTDVTLVGSSLVKYGLNDRTDIELGVTPLEILRVHGGGTKERASGFGDTLLRLKHRLTPAGAPWEVALDPYLKVPTAGHQFGNGRFETGLVVPMNGSLGRSGLTLSVDPELDLLADEDGRWRHAAMIQVVNLGAPLSEKFSVSAELWGMWNWDPAGTEKQASVDVSAAYQVNNDLQLDAGANFGLNRQTPLVEFYTGVSARF